MIEKEGYSDNVNNDKNDSSYYNTIYIYNDKDSTKVNFKTKIPSPTRKVMNAR